MRQPRRFGNREGRRGECYHHRSRRCTERHAVNRTTIQISLISCQNVRHFKKCYTDRLLSVRVLDYFDNINYITKLKIQIVYCYKGCSSINVTMCFCGLNVVWLYM